MADEQATSEDVAMESAGSLPQLDATSLVETAELESQVKEMYRQVAEGEDAELHYRFISDRALDACNTYGVQSVSLVARKTA